MKARGIAASHPQTCPICKACRSRVTRRRLKQIEAAYVAWLLSPAQCRHALRVGLEVWSEHALARGLADRRRANIAGAADCVLTAALAAGEVATARAALAMLAAPPAPPGRKEGDEQPGPGSVQPRAEQRPSLTYEELVSQPTRPAAGRRPPGTPRGGAVQ